MDFYTEDTLPDPLKRYREFPAANSGPVTYDFVDVEGTPDGVHKFVVGLMHEDGVTDVDAALQRAFGDD